ncbi:MATE family efflux transporter [Methanobrevibacter boviskoreani]|uniref:MATE family efflux transporter n=1 Tax=Methanobrevibacter boviskoreani TaxID=1348249 RepID=UPI0005931042|nr:MATE family efflux transporter [Methanobrevibacter boviskoreani]
MANQTEKGKNSNIDIITGDPKKAINKLAVPMMVSMLLIMAYNLADSIWVAGLGSDALAAIGFITPLFMILVGVGNGIGSGANSLIARAIGGKDKKLADNAAVHTVILTVILSILVPVILLPFLRDVLLLMGAGSTTNLGLQYGYIVFGLMFFFVFSGVGTAILRSEGDVNRAMYVTAATAALNIVLDPIFIYPMGMGITGAAWASVISAGISCVIMAYWIWVKKDTYLNVGRSEFKASRHILKEILIVAVPASAEQLIVSLLVMAINGMLVIVATSNAVAGYTAAMRIIQMAMIPLIGIGTAVLTVVGAAYGGRDYKKLDVAFNYSVKLGFLFSVILCIVLYIFAGNIAFVFTYTETSVGLAPMITDLIKITCFFLIGMPFGIAASMTFQGVGKGITSLILTLFRALLFELVFSYVGGFILGLGANGIYYGLVIGATIGGFVAFTWAKLFIRRLKRSSTDLYVKG